MKSNMATLKSDKKKRCKCSVKGKESDLFAVFFFLFCFSCLVTIYGYSKANKYLNIKRFCKFYDFEIMEEFKNLTF